MMHENAKCAWLLSILNSHVCWECWKCKVHLQHFFLLLFSSHHENINHHKARTSGVVCLDNTPEQLWFREASIAVVVKVLEPTLQFQWNCRRSLHGNSMYNTVRGVECVIKNMSTNWSLVNEQMSNPEDQFRVWCGSVHAFQNIILDSWKTWIQRRFSQATLCIWQFGRGTWHWPSQWSTKDSKDSKSPHTSGWINHE